MNNNEIRKAVKECLCQRCDCIYPVWFTDNDIWNMVQKYWWDNGVELHFLCSTCFSVLAEASKLYVPTAWYLTTEKVNEQVNINR